MRNAQKGMTIVSLMVGLLISMLCLIALLTLFRAVVTTSVDSQQNAQQDTQLFNGLTLAQMFAQNAGFGFSTGTNILINSNTLTGGNITVPTQKAVLWRYYTTPNTSNTLTCQGIASISDQNQKKLILLKSNTCAQTDSLDGLNDWAVDRVLAILPNSSTISFTLDTSNTCSPYGIGTVAAHYKLTITANAFSFPVCLSNITS